MLLSSSCEAELKLHAVISHLKAIGLSISFCKCAGIASPASGRGEVRLPGGGSLRTVPSFMFLGVLQAFQVTSQQVLAQRLTKAMNSFWGFYSILRASCTPLHHRFRLFTSFITSKWRWMSGCVRPVTATLKLANVCMLQMVVQMTGLDYDDFSSPVHNWLARRRASKMILQILNVHMWAGVLARMHWSFWGHVARIADRTRAVQVAIACSFSLDLQHRRALGNWPDHRRLLQLSWQSVREATDLPAWFSAAQNWGEIN